MARTSPTATPVIALLVFTAGHVAAALSDDFTVWLPARFICGAATGTFWAVGAVLASAAAGRAVSVKATAVIASGLTLWSANPVAVIVLFILLGAVAMAPQPILIAAVGQIAAPTNTLAIALSVSSLTIGIALGSWSGGAMLASSLRLQGPSMLGTGVAVLAAVALAVAATSVKRPVGPAALAHTL